jgi:hypothetical protein
MRILIRKQEMEERETSREAESNQRSDEMEEKQSYDVPEANENDIGRKITGTILMSIIGIPRRRFRCRPRHYLLLL